MRLSTFCTTQAVSFPCPSSRCTIGQNWYFMNVKYRGQSDVQMIMVHCHV